MGYTGQKKRDYQNKWLQNRRRAYLEGKECVKCSSTTDLEIHHIDPSTKTDHRVWSWRKERQEAELAKCEVLCRCCHHKETAVQFAFHGAGRYNHGGCRCEICKWGRKHRIARIKRKTTLSYEEWMAQKYTKEEIKVVNYQDMIRC